MNKFKKGDKVKCIQPGGSTKYNIELNKIYTVSKIGNGIDKDLIYLKEAPLDTCWFSKRFELVIEDTPILMQKEIKPKTSGWGF